jgi:hypothetical protein
METTSTEEKKQQFRKNSCQNFSVVVDINEIPFIAENRKNSSAESV